MKILLPKVQTARLLSMLLIFSAFISQAAPLSVYAAESTAPADDKLYQNPSSNNVKDFNLESNLLKSGKWTYLKSDDPALASESITKLSKGDGTKYAVNEWTASPEKNEHTNYLNANGIVKSDGRTILWNYTLDGAYAGAKYGVNVKGTIGAGSVNIRIFKSSDNNPDAIEGTLENLFEFTGGTKEFDFTIPPEKLKEGDDIIFAIRSAKGANWWDDIRFNGTVKAMTMPQIDIVTPSQDTGVVAYGTEIGLTSKKEGVTIYYTLDGSDPKTSETKTMYTQPMAINKIATIKTFARSLGLEDSYVMTYKYFVPSAIRSMMGVNNGVVAEVEGVGWARGDLFWDRVEPQEGVYDMKALESYGRWILESRKKGVELIPVLCYVAPWAVNRQPYTFKHELTGYTYEFGAPVKEENQKIYRDRIMKDENGKVFSTWLGDFTTDKNPIAPDKVDRWEKFVGLAVDYLSKPPYNIQYFQVFNEAYPTSGFYMGGLEEYIENIHKPAAKAIQERGCKVVYGGWICGGPIQEFEQLLDKTDAWSTIDVFDLHYHTITSMEYIYEAAKKRGIKNPSVWQTEVGFTTKDSYVPNLYPRVFHWALDKGLQQNQDLVKMVWYANWSPDDPKAYGYRCSLLLGNKVSAHGKTMDAFAKLMYGQNVETFGNFRTTPYLKPERFEMLSAAEGFRVDKNKVVVAVHMMKQNNSNVFNDMNGTGASINLAFGNPTVNVDIAGIRGKVNVKRVDVLGNAQPLDYTEAGNNIIKVRLPIQDTNEEAKKINSKEAFGVTFYLVVESENEIESGSLTPTDF